MKLKLLAGIFFMLALFAAPIIFAGPALLADTMNGPNWAPASELVVSKAGCTRWQGVVSTCSIQYIGSARPEITPELHYFVYGSWAHERAVLLRSTKNPAVISTVQAVRDLSARQVTLGAWIAIWLASIGWVALASLARRSKPDRPIADARIRAEFPSTAPVMQPGSAPAFGRRGRKLLA